MAISSIDIAKLAGILEGEAAFTLSGANRTPTIQYSSTDLDVAQWMAEKLDCTVIGPYPPKAPRWQRKPLYRVNLTGARAVGWLMTIYQFMGQRRKARIKEVLSVWKAKTPNPKQVWTKHEKRHPTKTE